MTEALRPLDASDLVYPEDDGQPLSENMLHFQWIVTIKENLGLLFRDRADVFVAGDLLWYPVEGHPEIRQAPDAMVAFGPSRGDRRTYRQWDEGGVAPQVVFEVIPPGKRFGELLRKHRFYERYGVEEYYTYAPEQFILEGWRRVGSELTEIEAMNGWTSPLLGIRFALEDGPLRIYRPDGEWFLTVAEMYQEWEQARQRTAEYHRAAEEARQRTAEYNRAAEEARQRTAEIHRARDQARQATEEMNQRKLRLEAQLRAHGMNPEA